MYDRMKVLFIDPPGPSKGLNVGLAYLSSVLIADNQDVKILDFNNNSHNVEFRLKKSLEWKPDIIGFSFKSSTVNQGLEIMNHVKHVSMRNVRMICGGPHITLVGPEFLREEPEFKCGVVGEGEETIIELSHALADEKSLKKVKGIVYRHEDVVKFNSPRPFITNLDNLPFPNYEFFDSVDLKNIKNYPLITSRGCPFQCIYCCVGKISGPRWRARTPKNVLDELMHAKEKYKIQHFSVLDDNFTLNMKRAKRICELILNEELNLKWDCLNGVRADRLDLELLGLMKDSGCETISIGIESGSSKVFNNIKKGETLEAIVKAVENIKKVGIKVTASFIIGLPGENMKTIGESIDFANKLNLDLCLWNLAVPYPGTELFEWVQNNARFSHDYRHSFHFGAKPKSVFETDDFTEQERICAYEKAHIRTFSYYFLLDQKWSILRKTWKVLDGILKHDKDNLSVHLGKISQKVFKLLVKKFLSIFTYKLCRW